MTGITVMGPKGKETQDDYLIRIFHNVFSGKGDQPGLSPFPLTPLSELKLRAISELCVADDQPPFKDEFDSRGSKLITAVYHLPESVHMDLEMSNYGVCPMVPYFFPVMDAFNILGNIRGNPAGFGFEFFANVRKPIKTIAFAQNAPEDFLRRAAITVFNKEHLVEGGYREMVTRTGKFNLKPYGRNEEIDAAVVEGLIQFGGSKRTQNEVARDLMQSCSEYGEFTPEQYTLRHYDFKIDFSPNDGREKFRRGLDELLERVRLVFQDKVEKCAA